LKPREPAAVSIDPKVIVYCERLLVLKKVNAADVLAATFQYSKDRPPRAEVEQNVSKDDPSRWLNPPELEEVIFDRLHKLFASGERPETGNERLGAVTIVSKWMTAMITSHTNDSMIQAMAGGVQQPPPSSMFVREGLGMLVVDMLENQKTLELLNREQAKGRYIYCIY
jgi:mediator of RNA polymerase II transcription subunit 5